MHEEGDGAERYRRIKDDTGVGSSSWKWKEINTIIGMFTLVTSIVLRLVYCALTVHDCHDGINDLANHLR